MPPRKKPTPPPVPTLTLTGGALVVLLLGGLGWLIWKYPREACAVGEALCKEHMPAAPSPVVPTAPLPEGLLEDQVAAMHGCPRPSVQLDKHPGCWLPVAASPPCGIAVEWSGRCWSALILKSRRPSVQQPWR